MRGIARKALADLRTRPLQTVVLFAVILLAAGMLTISFALREQASSPYDRLLRETNGADLWMYTSEQDVLESLASWPEVVGTSGPFPRTRGESDIPTTRSSTVSLWGVKSEPPQIGRPLLQSGRWVLAAGEIVLEAGLARTTGLGPGDSIRITTGASAVTFTVVGTVLTSSRLPYPQYQPGVAYALEEDVLELAGGSPEWEMGVQLANPHGLGDFLRRAFDVAPPGTSLITADAMRNDAAENSEVPSILFAVFGAFAIGAVALIIANTVSAAVMAQYREIGILKSIGFTPNQVAAVFIGGQVGLAFVAAVAGSLLGFLAAPWLLADVASVLSAPRTPAFLPVTFAMVVIATVLLVAAFAWLPAWSGGRATPIRTIAGPNAHRGTASRLGGLAATLRLPTVIRIGIKDAFGRPMRSWFTVGALALAAATGAIALSINATLDAGLEDPSLFSGEIYDIELVRIPAGGLESARSIIDAHPGVAASTVEYDFVIEATPTERFTALRAIVEPGFAPYLVAGTEPTRPGEVLLTTRLARRWGLGVGDTFTREVSYFPVSGEPRPFGPVSFTVTGLYSDGDDDGATFLTRADTFAQAELREVSATIGMKLHDPAASETVVAELEDELGRGYDIYDEVSVTRGDLREAASSANPVLAGLTAMLFGIAMANVLTTLLFSVRERYREVGVLKAIGLTPGQVVTSIAASACLLGVLGAAIGIPLGLFVSEALFDHFGAEAGWKPGLAAVPELWKLALLAPVILAVAVAGAYVPARRAARMSPTEALRFE